MLKARERLAQAQEQAKSAQWKVAVALGNSVLGSFLGRQRPSNASVSKDNLAKTAGRATDRRADVSRAEADLDAALTELTEVELEYKRERHALGCED